MTETEIRQSPLYQSLETSVKLVLFERPDDIDEKIMEVFFPLIREFLQSFHDPRPVVIYNKETMIRVAVNFLIKHKNYISFSETFISDFEKAMEEEL